MTVREATSSTSKLQRVTPSCDTWSAICSKRTSILPASCRSPCGQFQSICPVRYTWNNQLDISQGSANRSKDFKIEREIDRERRLHCWSIVGGSLSLLIRRMLSFSHQSKLKYQSDARLDKDRYETVHFKRPQSIGVSNSSIAAS